MAFQPVAQTVQAVFFFEGVSGGPLNGCEAQPSLYVRDDVVGWDNTRQTALANYCEGWWETGKGMGSPLKTHFSNQWRLAKITVRDLSVSNGSNITNLVGTVGAAAGSDPPPPNLAVWIKFQGEAGSLPKDGGWFLPAGTESLLSGNDWAQSLIDDLEARMFDFSGALTTPLEGGNVNWDQVIVSRSESTNDDVKIARQALRDAITATRRLVGITNRVTDYIPMVEVASQRDRRAST